MPFPHFLVYLLLSICTYNPQQSGVDGIYVDLPRRIDTQVQELGDVRARELAPGDVADATLNLVKRAPRVGGFPFLRLRPEKQVHDPRFGRTLRREPRNTLSGTCSVAVEAPAWPIARPWLQCSSLGAITPKIKPAGWRACLLQMYIQGMLAIVVEF